MTFAEQLLSFPIFESSEFSQSTGKVYSLKYKIKVLNTYQDFTNEAKADDKIHPLTMTANFYGLDNPSVSNFLRQFKDSIIGKWDGCYCDR